MLIEKDYSLKKPEKIIGFFVINTCNRKPNDSRIMIHTRNLKTEGRNLYRINLPNHFSNVLSGDIIGSDLISVEIGEANVIIKTSSQRVIIFDAVDRPLV